MQWLPTGETDPVPRLKWVKIRFYNYSLKDPYKLSVPFRFVASRIIALSHHSILCQNIQMGGIFTL